MVVVAYSVVSRFHESHTEMPNISVIGSGTFGTVISSTLSRNKHNNVKLWCRRDEVAQEILNCSTHSTYFPSSTSSSFLKNVRATSDLKVALRKADIVVIAVPSQYLNGILSRLFIPENAVIVSLVKSLHYDPEKAKLELTSDTIERFFKKNEVVVLHGGNIYTEMIDDNGFAEATIGHRNTRSGLLAARKVKRSFDGKNFHTRCVRLCIFYTLVSNQHLHRNIVSRTIEQVWNLREV